MRAHTIGMVATVATTLVIHASEISQKRVIKSNMVEIYQKTPGNAESLSEMLEKGIFYSRLRLNSFAYQWDKEIDNKKKNHQTLGVGGSFIYKSAYLNGFGFTAGLYTTQNPWHMDESATKYYKAGKGVLSRYDVMSDGDYGITSLAQAYLDYKSKFASFHVGRQIFESFLTKSNDTKMIPNTFEGVSFYSSYLPHTKIKAAYLTAQKLRDHSSFHHLLAYGDDTSDLNAKWSENDDSGMHQGLTLSKLKALGIDDRLGIFEVYNNSLHNLNLMANYTTVPDLVSLATVEGAYTFHFAEGYKLAPALRYIKQFDDGAGKIGGANLKTKTYGYTNVDSVKSSMLAARIDFAKDNYKLRLGYSKVADDADLITPWRGFPTAGFTRAMAQYNWYANTETFMLRFDYDFDKADLIPGVNAFVRYVIQDFDDNKPGVQADSNVLTLDILKKFESMPNLYSKIRVAYGNGKDDTISGDGTLKGDPSYREFRFEINYLF